MFRAALCSLMTYFLLLTSIPGGIDLKICLGLDGHVDFFLDGCRETVVQADTCCATSKHQEDLTGDHHNACFDLEFGCGDSDLNFSNPFSDLQADLVADIGSQEHHLRSCRAVPKKISPKNLNRGSPEQLKSISTGIFLL